MRQGTTRLFIMLVLLAGIAGLAFVAWHPELVLDERKVSVAIEPAEALTAGAAWKISGPWMDRATMTLSAAAERSRVEFRSVPGWVTPDSIELGEQDRTVHGVYRRQALREETILRLHGSNTIGANLGPELARRYLQWLGADGVRLVEGGNPAEHMVEGVFTGRGETLRVEVKAHGSTTGFTDLASGTCDIAMASRRIKDKEQDALRRFGDMRALDSEYVVALDGIAVIVSRSNPLASLTKSQIAAIFAGRVTDWKEVGAGSGPIEIHARNDSSGTFDTFQNLVLGEDKLASRANRHESNAELSDAVAASPLAIGFCGLPYVNKARALAVQDEGVPILPSPMTVSTEDYPLARRLFLYAPASGRPMHVRQFLDFVLSREGQEATGQYGFVSLDIARRDAHAAPSPVTPTPAASTPAMAVSASTASQDAVAELAANDSAIMQGYMHAVRGCERIPVNFRFQFASFELDNKAVRDLSRVADLVRSAGGRRVVLVGFSDAVGDYAQNLALSKRRAQQVADRLHELGVSVDEVLGAGKEAPVASNEDPVGRERNRRVEAWMR